MPGSVPTSATAASLNPTVVVIGVLLMFLSWKGYAWFQLLIHVRKRTIWGTPRATTQEAADWDRLKMRILVFLFGLGLVVWQLGLAVGIWDSLPRR